MLKNKKKNRRMHLCVYASININNNVKRHTNHTVMRVTYNFNTMKEKAQYMKLSIKMNNKESTKTRKNQRKIHQD